MKPEHSLAIDRLERQLALLRELAAVLQQANAVLMGPDLNAIESHTRRQQELCEALRVLAPAEMASAAEMSPEIQQHRGVVLRELAQAKGHVAHLNRVHSAMLGRARRYLEIFACLIASSAPTYSCPPGALRERR